MIWLVLFLAVLLSSCAVAAATPNNAVESSEAESSVEAMTEDSSEAEVAPTILTRSLILEKTGKADSDDEGKLLEDALTLYAGENVTYRISGRLAWEYAYVREAFSADIKAARLALCTGHINS